MPTDAELLHRYVEDQSETAFAELVRRHLSLVYSAALRRTGGRRALAEEISQEVFSNLARKAARLLSHSALSAWLHLSTRYAAIDAIRRESRQEKLIRSLTAMHDETAPPESTVDWTSLRPVVDDALDQLKERDREIMLLRFFAGLTFAQVGTALNLSENAARMRTERALERLRRHLTNRGVTSTAGVLVGLLTNQALVAAPPGLIGTITTVAIASVPAGGSAGVTSLFFMNKIAAPAITAALAAGLTAIVWTSTHDLPAQELSALRAENVRLLQATGPKASEASVSAIADEFSAQATAILRVVMQRRPKANVASATLGASASLALSASVPAAGHNGHRNRGQTTPHDACMSFAWAADAAEIDALSQLLTFEDTDRKRALAILTSMPESIRTQYRTPEELYAFFFAADALIAPPPGADIIEGFEVVPLRPGRVTVRRPGTNGTYEQYQETPEGWKYVIPAVGVENAPNVLNNQTLAKVSAQ